MRRIVMVALVVISAVLAAAWQRSADPGDVRMIEKAVLETNDKMTRAADRLDAESFFSYILDTDKGAIIQNGKLFKTRAEALEAVKAGFRGFVKAERRYDQIHVTVISPDVALLTSSGTTTATLPDGRSLSSRFAVSLVFVLRDGQWKVLHGHYSMPTGQ
jgi:uncharacterized protein (TIGR02246 family)